MSHYLEVFHLEFDGMAHDPKYDAINLARLYDAFMKEDEVVFNEFIKNMGRMNFHPAPVDKVIKKLLMGETVTPEEFEEYTRDYIK